MSDNVTVTQAEDRRAQRQAYEDWCMTFFDKHPIGLTADQDKASFSAFKAGAAYASRIASQQSVPNSVVEAYRYDFDGYGWKYIDRGSGSDWQDRVKMYSDAEALTTLKQSGQTAPAGDELREAVGIGERDGYEKAIQDLDIATGGDGEFKGSTIPGETIDVPVMKQRIIDRIAALTAAKSQNAELLRKAAKGFDVVTFATHPDSEELQMEEAKAVEAELADYLKATQGEGA